MNLLEPTHLIIIAVIILVLFGGKKIPELMRGVGQGVGEFHKGLDETKKVLSAAAQDAKKEPAESATIENNGVKAPEKPAAATAAEASTKG